MLNDMKLGLKQRFNIKCAIDILVFVAILALFVTFSLKHHVGAYEGLSYTLIMLMIFIPSHWATKQWINSSIKKSLTTQSETLSNTTKDIIETLNSQKNILENLNTNSKNVSALIDKFSLDERDIFVKVLFSASENLTFSKIILITFPSAAYFWYSKSSEFDNTTLPFLRTIVVS